MIEASYYKFLKLARSISEHSEIHGQHQVIALLIKGSKAIGIGVSSRRYQRGVSYFVDSVHAEADLLYRYKDKVKGSKVFVYRFNTATSSPFQNEPLCSKPCLLCAHVLKESGIRKVVYFTNNKEVEELSNRELTSLVEDPHILTRFFLDKYINSSSDGKFIPSDYLKG